MMTAMAFGGSKGSGGGGGGFGAGGGGGGACMTCGGGAPPSGGMAPSAGGGGPLQEAGRTRSSFPETWLWVDSSIGYCHDVFSILWFMGSDGYHVICGSG